MLRGTAALMFTRSRPTSEQLASTSEDSEVNTSKSATFALLFCPLAEVAN